MFDEIEDHRLGGCVLQHANAKLTRLTSLDLTKPHQIRRVFAEQGDLDRAREASAVAARYGCQWKEVVAERATNVGLRPSRRDDHKITISIERRDDG